MWFDMVRSHRMIEQAYAPPSRRSNVEVTDAVNQFFLAADHLVDWLKGDVNRLPGVSVASIEEFRTKDRDMKICHGYSIAAKHRTRTSEPKLECRWEDVKMFPGGGAQVTLVVADPRLDSQRRVDALDLATRVLQKWRDWLRSRGVEPPE